MTNLETFAQNARRQLREQVTARLAQVLRTDSVELREQAEAVAALQAEIKKSTKDAVIETVAYTWFNRFCALRFMDANHYSRVKIVSPAAGHTQPEILFEAKQGHIDPDLPLDAARVLALLGGRTPASQPQAEAYRLLLVATCNAYHETMPFLFEKINDWTELLLPADLLSENSIVQAVRQALTAERCQDVEVIGWLYQYYIAERKDEVFANLKKRKKIQPRDIPAATQLFTPHWIVRYLVENSLGRLWLQNRPNSRLAEGMDYYIAPQPPNGGSLESPPSPPTGGEKQIPPSGGLGGRISSPEELRICDPACGSGHMLTYAFDLLVRIYEEAGYPPGDIPRLILEKNLTGLEIDRRAAALAAFALTMKARQYDRRFLRRGVTPHIVLLEPVALTDHEIEEYMQAVSDTPPAPQGGEQKLETNSPLWGVRGAFEATLRQFAQADNFGALIRPALSQPDGALSLSKGADAAAMRQRLNDRLLSLSKDGQPDLFLHATHQRVLRILDYAEALSQRYHVVIANPPYMGSGGMNKTLKKFAKDQYPDSKRDLFAMFMDRNLELTRPGGLTAMITMQSWMFLSSFEKLRSKIVEQNSLLTMAHLGPRAFDTIGGEVVSTTAFVASNRANPDYAGTFLRLIDGDSEAEKADMLRRNIPATGDPLPANCYRAATADFKKIPGSPIAYWVSDRVRTIFELETSLKDILSPKQGTSTGNDEKFVRYWFEIDVHKLGLGFETLNEALNSSKKYYPLDKGGDFRRWYGNNEKVICLDSRCFEELLNMGNHLPSRNIYFEKGLTWSKITSNQISVRYDDYGFVFSSVGLKGFPANNILLQVFAYMNSCLVTKFTKILSPTLSIISGDIEKLPFKHLEDAIARNVETNTSCLLSHGQSDWDSYETSWDFTTLPLLRKEHRRETLAETYAALRQQWQEMTLEMQRLEEENNRIFIEAYGLQEELTPEVPLTEITLTCNPAYRYGGKKSKAALEKRLRQDTIKEFVSYSVGCMVGRYALDKPGLILANQGDTAADYLAQVPQPTFPADEDNVIPILDEGWFEDDITARFKDFLRLTFGQEQYAANLAFVETALGKDIRSYFLRDFYKDHVKTYKKRPIYWLFSSPKGSFQALVYMHRYRPDTLSVILNDYLRQYRDKLTAHRRHLEAVSTSGTSREKTQALKAIDQLTKTLAELKEYEDEILYPLATQKLEIDLDDGVKVNYKKFGKALEKVRGLS